MFVVQECKVDEGNAGYRVVCFILLTRQRNKDIWKEAEYSTFSFHLQSPPRVASLLGLSRDKACEAAGGKSQRSGATWGFPGLSETPARISPKAAKKVNRPTPG